jgi:hypothetical protein
MNEFIYGIITGWFFHALWVFMIRPILRKAQEK